ncbi:phage tail assembly protein T [Salmonella enterica subsp. enterica serovar Miami]|nr:phage tail assembly protein T [Salmonella enterica subsp. enterica serovar Miami]EDO3656220.1 phage tail assembly protein T [Salmonella enterica]EKO1093433.1 phage tail assembly protein T [Salmonella enterica subsp. enterica]EEE1025337.1 phage tail assembly protein T [Salmonella enterica subsp. enterica serovar Miami]EFP4423988.1 phage tail assembly protein T [Salmonella enterica]
MQLAQHFRRPDWRRMLSEMSASELGEWAEHFRQYSFSDTLLDAEFSTLKSLIVTLVSGEKVAAEDFSLMPGAEPEPGKDENELIEAATGILGGMRFEPESR